MDGVGTRLRGGPAASKPTPWLRKVFEQMLEDGFNPHRKWVLDLGAGNGRNSEWLWNQDMHVHAFDPSPAGEMVSYWNGKGWPPFCIHHGYDIILLQYVLMFVPEANLRYLTTIVNMAARFNCVLILEAYKAKSGLHYRRRMLYDFVATLKEGAYPGHWERCATEGDDHLAFQLRQR